MRQEGCQTSPDLSIIIPAHNESARILPYLQSITAYLSRQTRAYEVLVVDDGSLDDTAALVQRYARQTPFVRLIRLPVCAGKGAAVRHGMQAARGRWQLFTDADGATPIAELERLEQAVQSGAHIAIGSRRLASRRSDFTVNASWHRSLLGNLFNFIVRIGGVSDITDTQCGFKLFERTVAQDLFSVSCINGYGFDLELLYVAQRRGYRIAEVPVNWTDQPGSKVRLIRDGVGMIRELLTIRRNAGRGIYSDRVAQRPLPALTSSPAVLE